MRTLFLIIFATFSMSISAQDADYAMFETVRMEANNANIAELQEAMAHHNQTYHNTGPYSASVWQIATGPDIGKIVWMMGPLTFSDLDTRPAGEHDEDWAGKVLPHVKSMANGEYWRLNAELSYMSGANRPIVAVRYLEVAKGTNLTRVQSMLKSISDVVKAADNGRPWSVYINEFQQGYDIGRHIALVRNIGSWSEFDEADTFQDDYVALHGEGSWGPFLDRWDEVFSNSWDEVWSLIPELSGPQPEEDGEE